MKRASTKKVKAVPACAAGNDAPEGHFKPVRPKFKRRVRTSVAMIGLTISMGAPNLLLNRQSNRAPAAEPVNNDPTVSTFTATTEADLGKSINSVEPEAVKSVLPVTSDSVAVPSNPLAQMKAAVSTPALPVVEHTVQKGQTLRQLSQKYQVDTATLVKLSEGIIPSNSLPEYPDRQAGKVLETPPVNKIVHIKADKTVETLSESYGNKPSSFFTPLAAMTAASQQLQVGAPQRVTGEVNTGLTKQRVLINRLKDSLAESNNSSAPATVSAEPSSKVNTGLTQQRVLINRLKDSLAESKSEESNNSSAPATVSAPSSSVEKAHTEPASLASPVAGATVGQEPVERWRATLLSPEVTTSKKSAVLDAQKWQHPAAAVVVPNVPKNGVNEPTVVVASVSPDYQVKAGDTLTAIARNHGFSLSELVNANQLSNPDRLKINQRIRIPAPQYSTAGQTIAVIKRPTQPETTASSVAVAMLKTASSNPTLPVVPPLSPSANNSSVSVPTLPKTGEFQPNAESIAYNEARGSQQDASVPPEPLAGTPSPNAAFSGIGGSISDEADQLGPPTFDKSQLESTAAKPEAQSDPYVQNLRTDIQRLRQKYYTQQTVSQVVPGVSETGNEPINPEFRPAQAAKPLQPGINKQRPTKDSSPSPATGRARLATAPINVDPSESLGSVRGRQQVSPELPPLAPVDNYLPQSSPSAAPFKKGYVWPTKGALTSGYGWRWGRMHRGIDIAAPIGTPVVAAAPGFVVKTGWNSGGYGNLVEIKHADGSLTRYAHNKRILVHLGQEVEQGQQISAMGSTGRSTGPHLHFEVHPAGKGAVNPIAYLPR